MLRDAEIVAIGGHLYAQRMRHHAIYAINDPSRKTAMLLRLMRQISYGQYGGTIEHSARAQLGDFFSVNFGTRYNDLAIWTLARLGLNRRRSVLADS